MTKANPAPAYSAADIEVLEGLEPVRKRPGMYIGGTDATAMHHLVNEVLDNSMDEAVAGHADTIWVTLHKDNTLTVEDNGRGIPIDPHPKYPEKSALEVIMTTLHAGGKFSDKVYATSGGLHGVGISVVNALSSRVEVVVTRDKVKHRQTFQRGTPIEGLTELGTTNRKSGTAVTFTPDTEIFGDLPFEAKRLEKLVRSKAYLYRGVTLHWRDETQDPIAQDKIHYENGLADFVADQVGEKPTITAEPFAATATLLDKDGKEAGRVELALAWPLYADTQFTSYVNTIPTAQGGTHEAGCRAALLKGLKAFAEKRNIKIASITADDVMSGALGVLSAFVKDPQFQGQTKDKLTNSVVNRQVEAALQDPLDLWLAANPDSAESLLDKANERARERARRKQEQDVKRKTATSRRLRLPGKLADCAQNNAEGTELFIVEGDSAGGSAKQARDRKTQAVLPLKGKILNVASATTDKLKQNKEIQDLLQALGVATGADFKAEDLRYERVVIMTDADVDGAHIATLLMTFFYQEIPQLVLDGRLYLAMPPLYKVAAGAQSAFAIDEKHKDELVNTKFKGKKVELSRFKGLGEMTPSQLKETTMDPKKRLIMKVELDNLSTAKPLVKQLMGRDPALRLNFIRENAQMGAPLDV